MSISMFQDGRSQPRIFHSPLDEAEFNGAPKPANSRFPRPTPGSAIAKLGLSQNDVRAQFSAKEIDGDIARLYQAVRGAFPGRAPALNQIGGMGGFALAMGIAPEVLERIEDLLSRSLGIVKLAANRFGSNADAFKDTYSTIISGLGLEQTTDIREAKVRAGGLLYELKDAYLAGTFPEPKSPLLQMLSDEFSRFASPEKITVDIIRHGVLQWLSTAEPGHNNWQLPSLKNELAPIFPFIKATSVSYGQVLWGLDIHREFLLEYNALSSQYNGQLTPHDYGKRFGWKPKTSGEFETVFASIKELCIRQGAGELFAVKDESLNSPHAITVNGGTTNESFADTSRFRVLTRLGLLGHSSEEITELLSDPKIDFNIAKFVKDRGAGDWFRKNGIEVLISGLGQEEAFKKRLIELVPYYNGTLGLIGKHLGLSIACLNTLARFVNVSLNTNDFPAGYLLKTFNVTKGEVLKELERNDWATLGTLKPRMLAKMAAEAPNGNPIFQDANVSRAEIVWGLDIAQEAASVIEARAVDLAYSPKRIGKALGYQHSPDLVLEQILNLAQPVRRFEWPSSIIALDFRLCHYVPSIRNFRERIEAYHDIHKQCEVNAPAKVTYAPAHSQGLPKFRDLELAWHANKQNLTKGGAPLITPTRGLFLTSTFWAPSTTSISIGFRRQVDAVVRELRSVHPHCKYLWIETGVAQDADLKRKPVVYIAAIDPVRQNATHIVRLIESSPHLFHRRDYGPLVANPIQESLFETIHQQGYRISEQEISLDYRCQRMRAQIERLISLEEGSWDELSKDELFNFFDDLTQNLVNSRKASGTTLLLKSQEEDGERRNGPSLLEVPFLLRSSSLAESFSLAEKLLSNQDSLDPVLANHFAKSLGRNKALRDIAGFQEFVLFPLEILETSLTKDPSEKAKEIVLGLAQRLVNLRREFSFDPNDEAIFERDQSDQVSLEQVGNPIQQLGQLLELLRSATERNANEAAQDIAAQLLPLARRLLPNSDSLSLEREMVSAWSRVISPVMLQARNFLMPQAFGDKVGTAERQDIKFDQRVVQGVFEFTASIQNDSLFGHLSELRRAEVFEFSGDLLAFVIGDQDSARGEWIKAYQSANEAGAAQGKQRAQKLLVKINSVEVESADPSSTQAILAAEKILNEPLSHESFTDRKEAIASILAIQPFHISALAANEIVAVEDQINATVELMRAGTTFFSEPAKVSLVRCRAALKIFETHTTSEAAVTYLRTRVIEASNRFEDRSAEWIVEKFEDAIDSLLYSEEKHFQIAKTWIEKDLLKALESPAIPQARRENLTERLDKTTKRFFESRSILPEVQQANALLKKLSAVPASAAYQERFKAAAIRLVTEIVRLSPSSDKNLSRHHITSARTAFQGMRSVLRDNSKQIAFSERDEFEEVEMLCSRALKKLQN